MKNRNQDLANDIPVKSADNTDENCDKKPENCFQKMDTKKNDSRDEEQKRIDRKKDPIDY